jgi:hypothetical protein
MTKERNQNPMRKRHAKKHRDIKITREMIHAKRQLVSGNISMKTRGSISLGVSGEDGNGGVARALFL